MPALRARETHEPARALVDFFGFGYAGSCQSAGEVGGDLYEVVPLSNSSLLLAMADVMGKGIPASLFAGSLRTLILAMAAPDLCPATCLDELNKILFEDLSSADTFITAQLAVVDFHHRELLVASAGHCPLLISGPSRSTQSISPEGIPLGIRPNASYQLQRENLESFGSILLYTDGITEARNRVGEFFGQHRLETWFTGAVQWNESARALKAGLQRELTLFQASAQAADDQTFLILSDETPRTGFLSRDNLRSLLNLPRSSSGASSSRV